MNPKRRVNFVQVKDDFQKPGLREVHELLIGPESHGRLMENHLTKREFQHPTYKEKENRIVPAIRGKNCTIIGLGKGTYNPNTNTMTQITKAKFTDDYNSLGVDIGVNIPHLDQFAEETGFKYEFKKMRRSY